MIFSLRVILQAICLNQWFSIYFSTVQHYGPSASLTGRTHVIYILVTNTNQPDL